ncbi:hypothetical protein, partial [Mesorhizobium sp.]|uniref:hypothetical protein n=1 Tax=Mesorhizobium sp. TaxID=1871066 RepID=UPI0025B8D18F
ADAGDCHQPACGFVFTSETPDLPIKLLLFTADLLMDRQKRLNQRPKRMAVSNQFPNLSPEL